MSALRWFAAARSAEQTLALWVATPPGSPCCAVKRDNTHSGLCLHVGEEGLSGNPQPNLKSWLQLQFPHGCVDFFLKQHKSWLPTFPRGCAEPSLARPCTSRCLSALHQAQDAISAAEGRVTAGENFCSAIGRS